MAYAQVEPFGPEREDLRFALICTTMANAWRGKDARPFKLQDFVLDFSPRKSGQSAEQMEAFMKVFANTHNAALQARKG